MATLTATKFECFWEDALHGVHDFSSDQIKIALTNSAPSASADAVLGDITQISAGNGYTTGGENVTVSSSSQTGGTYTLVGSGTAVWTATGTMAAFRYPVMYNDDATTDKLIDFFDIGSAVTLNVGDSYTLDMATTLIQVS